VLCFKQNLSVEPFFDLIYDVYGAADKRGVPRIKTHIDTELELIQSRVRRAKYIEGISQQKKNLKNSGQTDPCLP
jgi:hypothetical protein